MPCAARLRAFDIWDRFFSHAYGRRKIYLLSSAGAVTPRYHSGDFAADFSDAGSGEVLECGGDSRGIYQFLTDGKTVFTSSVAVAVKALTIGLVGRLSIKSTIFR